MKRPLLVIGLTAVLLGLGAVGVRHESKAELQRALSSFRANLPPDARFDYDRAYPRILARGAGFENARFTRGPVKVTARHLTVNNPSGYLVSGLRFSRIHASGVSLKGPIEGQIADITLYQLLLPPMNREKLEVTDLPPASLIHFKHALIHGLALTPSWPLCTIRLERGELDNYGHDDGNAAMLHNAQFLCSSSSPLTKILAQALDRNPSPPAFSIMDFHETGIRLARLISLIESSKSDATAEEKPKTELAASDLFETANTSSASRISLMAPGIHCQIDSMHHKQWTKADVIHTQGAVDHLFLNGLPFQVAFSPPNGVTIKHLTHEASTDTNTHQSHLVFQAMTPGIFTAGLTAEGMNSKQYNGIVMSLISRISISYKDEGHTIDTLIQRIANSQGAPLDQFRARLLVALTSLSHTAPGLNALPGFVEAPQGHEFLLTFTPPEPLDAHALSRLDAELRTDPTKRQRWLSPPVLSTNVR